MQNILHIPEKEYKHRNKKDKFTLKNKEKTMNFYDV